MAKQRLPGVPPTLRSTAQYREQMRLTPCLLLEKAIQRPPIKIGVMGSAGTLMSSGCGIWRHPEAMEPYAQQQSHEMADAALRLEPLYPAYAVMKNRWAIIPRS